MKAWGIGLLVIGALATLGAIIGAANGQKSSFSGLALIVLGAFLLSRANKKKEEEEKRKRWEQDNTNNTN